MSKQLGLFNVDSLMPLYENEDFLTKQIITYIGNKRALLNFIEQGLKQVQKKLNKKKLRIFDVFSGSGVVARHFKQYASLLLVNDLEKYVKIISECYLSNCSDIDMNQLKEIHNELIALIRKVSLKS